MQRKATRWIIGGFKTTPGGASESMAGLPPIHRHVRKLVERNHYRGATLVESHPIISMMEDDSHPAGLQSMPAKVKAKVFSLLVDISDHMDKVTEVVEPFTDEGILGSRIQD